MLEFKIKDLFDILIVAILFYQAYRLVKGTSAMNIFALLFTFVITWFFVSYVFQMELLGSILNAVANVGIILLVILFQDEIRSFIGQITNRYSNNFYARLKRRFFPKQDNQKDDDISQIVQSMVDCARTKTGALIVIQNDGDLTNYWHTGEVIDAQIKARLIENLFYKNTPLHDGAIIIIGDKIKAVGCILPISHKLDLPKELGLRHRAALGITERTDASVVVVSEETGRISCMRQSEIWLGVQPADLEHFLRHQAMNQEISYSEQGFLNQK